MAGKYNICLDIGGTKVLGAIFDKNKEIVYRLKKKTKEGGDSKENVEEVIISVVAEMLEGSGIKKKDISNVFRPGFTTKKRGWGLGLSLAKRIAEEYHKGRIFVKESEVGRGTTFRVELKK